MTHLHYYQIKAQTHFELGYKTAHLFKESFFETYSQLLEKAASHTPLVTNAQSYLRLVTERFPYYIEELKGYANGMGIEFGNYWLMYLYTTLEEILEKCTTCFSSDGMIIGHNEDNYSFLASRISLLEKTIQGTTILELYYSHGLGGDACGINSHGYVQTINSLHHNDTQIGIPSSVIARWLSETKSPINDFEEMKKMTRAAGYSHTFGNLQGEVINIESTARFAELVRPSLPFIHTNHHLTNLSIHEDTTNPGNSRERFNKATELAGSVKSPQDMMKLLESVTSLPSNDERTCKTLARMVFDLREKEVWCWLAQEASEGWIKYPIHFL